MLSDTVENTDSAIKHLDIERNASENCGFHLTRGKWDPYPWVSEVDCGTAAFNAGVKPGDCLLEVNGEDIIGRKICEIAEIVKAKPQVSLLLWNAGVDPQCTPEAVCCGPMPTNLQRLSACMSTILAFLECPVCLDTIPPPTYQCDNGHLICIRCRSKSERCPVCRLKFNRARSLFSDQVYNALIDAFNLKEEPDELKTKKMQQIFKMKNKNKNVPDIKITQTHQSNSHTNKFLARLIGKSSSVDNLTSTSNSDDTNLRIKSLSTNEIFQFESPAVSRSTSINKLSRNDGNKYLKSNPDNRPASYHGSFESIDVITNFSMEEGVLFHCPFNSNCISLIKGREIIEHFQLNHDGPLIQFFKPTLSISLHDIIKKDICYIIHKQNNIFYLKSESTRNKTHISSSEDILLWVWLLGNKKLSKDYEMQLKIINKNTNVIVICVRNSVCSLSSISHQEIKEFKKGVFLNTKTLLGLDSSPKDVILNISIIKNDCD